MMEHPEIGRELTITDLAPGRIVVIEPASQSFCLTIAAVDAEFVLFYAGAERARPSAMLS